MATELFWKKEKDDLVESWGVLDHISVPLPAYYVSLSFNLSLQYVTVAGGGFLSTLILFIPSPSHLLENMGLLT